ncbi:MAG TPA: diacylglycerol kinase family protein [Bacteroidales bacterium]|nr:diacylglycerol kinase family protein [Bacteroidales bacterium]
MNSEQKWVFIINPVAGDGFAGKLEATIKEAAKTSGIIADTVLTERRGHATGLALKYADDGYKYIIAVGGDGTFNEVASALVNRPGIISGIVPAGTGNDFVQILGFHDRLGEEQWKELFCANVAQLDTGICNGHFFFNGMGLGFDAQVAAENYTETGEEKKGDKKKYIWQILKTILFYKEKKMTVISNGSKSITDCFINTISIGRRFAGAFFLTPKAIADDGLLDVCSVKKLNLFQRLKILTQVPKGNHLNDRKVHYYSTSALDLEFDEKVPYHLDGELFFSDKFEIRVLKKSLNVIYNSSGKHYFCLS